MIINVLDFLNQKSLIGAWPYEPASKGVLQSISSLILACPG